MSEPVGLDLALARRPRVLEVGETLSGAYAGLVLAALGWEVCQVSLPSRQVTELEAAFYDRARTTVAGGAAVVGRLARRADVVLTDVSVARIAELGLAADAETLQRGWPGLVQVSVTPFGLWGPHAGYEAAEITEWAAGGLAYATRRPVGPDDVDGYTPVLPPGRQTSARWPGCAWRGRPARPCWSMCPVRRS
jgi:crotonobetainyl-CoA:carnitine CoA-transferase CaiB-like acyl-CoA transferase